MTTIINGSSPSITFSDATTQSTGVPSPSAVGQIPIGNSSNGYTAATITAGSNITVTNASGAITIASSGGAGTVTSVATGNGLSGGTITSTGTLTVACPSTGSVGAYSFLRIATGGSGVAAGSTASGSILRYCQVTSDAGVILGDVGTPSGTWRNMLNGTWEYGWATVACRVS